MCYIIPSVPPAQSVTYTGTLYTVTIPITAVIMGQTTTGAQTILPSPMGRRGDGKQLNITVNGVRHTFCWYAFCDQHTTLLVGSSITGAESSDAFCSHPHWLNYFRVSKLAPAASQVRHLGGDVVGIYPSPLGHDIAVCHDPQGAAFGLVAAS
ncbi:MAG: hypothetical protein FJ146_13595 [Deltaproteobacteria bacterium]|nr:hypothetical protein [Deltaproteobacteria bacterium]